MRSPAAHPSRPFSASAHDTHGRHADRRSAQPALSRAPTVAWPQRISLASAFASTVASYLVAVLPQLERELAHWRARALSIPDPVLRRLALDALAKRGNMEGAALFAVLAPHTHRRATVRALVAFQAAYNYLDMLAEQPNSNPVDNGYQLHQALLLALDREAAQPDYYAHYPRRGDGGHLAAMVDACRSALVALPSYDVVRDEASAAAARIVAFQSLNLTEAQGGHELLERWARDRQPQAWGLEWWQLAASCGSSLTVYALIAMAATPGLDAGEVVEVSEAYFPWIGALHSLLDSLVDATEDQRDGQRSLLSHHASSADAADAMRRLTRRAAGAARDLRSGRQHTVILTAMVSYYLSAPEAREAAARAIARSVKAAAGPLLRPALLLFKLRRGCFDLGRDPYK